LSENSTGDRGAEAAMRSKMASPANLGLSCPPAIHTSRGFGECDNISVCAVSDPSRRCCAFIYFWVSQMMRGGPSRSPETASTSPVSTRQAKYASWCARVSHSS
jgi:hypothetical protein